MFPAISMEIHSCAWAPHRMLVRTPRVAYFTSSIQIAVGMKGSAKDMDTSRSRWSSGDSSCLIKFTSDEMVAGTYEEFKG